ncbi:MAG: glycosyltransferase family 2 protein [Actinobacteria bacterium]|nr:glycosyltransferase family 2 protein [Actinomycetota bacterium]
MFERAVPELESEPTERTAPTYSLVIPVYRNEDTLGELLDVVEGLAERIAGRIEVIFVVDGSPDESATYLREELPNRCMPGLVVELSRNFGSFAAIRCGLELARGDYSAVMAADLQEPASLIEDFFKILAAGDADVVVGERTSRADPTSTKAGSSLFWWLYRRVAQPDMPEGGVDVFGCNASARRAVLGLQESNSSLVGLLIWIGFRRVGVPYERLARPSGKSGWSFGKKVRYLMDSIFSFTDLPIRLLLFVGVFGTIGSVLAAILVLTAWLLRRVEVPGYTPLMLALLIVGGLAISALGIIGSYVWRTYENTKRRPSSIVRSMDRYSGTEP